MIRTRQHHPTEICLVLMMAALLGLGTPGPASALEADYGQHTRWQSTTAVSTSGLDIAVVGDHLYRGQLSVIDIQDPRSPRLQGEILLPGQQVELVVEGSRAYCLTDGSGLYVVDVSDPDQPVVLGNYFPVDGNYSSALAVVGERAIVSLSTSDFVGLKNVDLSDPGHPVELGSFEDVVPVDHIVPAEGYLYVDVTGSILVMETLESGDIALRAEVRGCTPIQDLFYHSGYLLVCRWDRLQVIDVRQPLLPEIIAEYPDVEATNHAAVVGDTLYVSTQDRFWTIDIGDPASPQLQSVPRFAQWSEFTVRDGIVLANGTWLDTYEIKAAGQVPSIGSTKVIHNGSGLCWDSDFAYLSFEGGFQIVDLSNPSSPRSRGSLDLMIHASSLFVHGSKAILTDSTHGLRSLDLRDPDHPVPFDYLQIDGGVTDAAPVTDRYAYASRRLGDVYVVDMSDVENLTVASTVSMPSPSKIVVLGSWVVVVSHGGSAYVLDATDPAHPVIASEFEFAGSVLGMDAEEGLLFVGSVGERLRELLVMNVDPQGQLHVVSRLPMPLRLNDVEVRGNLVYVACKSAGTQIVDVSDPTAPRLVGSALSVKGTNWVAVAPDYMVTSETSLGVRVFPVQMQKDSVPVLLQAFDVDIVDTAVHVSGAFAGPVDVADLRLRASTGSRGWDVHVASTGGSEFEAWDRSRELLHVRTATYTLSVRGGASGWETLDQQTVELSPRRSGLHILSIAPNPFNPRTVVAFQAPAGERVVIRVLDVRGRAVGTLFDGVGTGLRQEVVWAPESSASGVRYVRIESESGNETRRVTLLK